VVSRLFEDVFCDFGPDFTVFDVNGEESNINKTILFFYHVLRMKDGVPRWEPFDVDVFYSTKYYVKLMNTIFDFEAIQKSLTCPKFMFFYDALHRVVGIYAKGDFVVELSTSERSLINYTLKDDFGGGYPNPNLTYAKELVTLMGLGEEDLGSEPQEC
jgi:phosphoglucomutase